jgi:hypothetical protein
MQPPRCSPPQNRSQGRRGVICHTQSSGKSFSTVFLAPEVLRKLTESPQPAPISKNSQYSQYSQWSICIGSPKYAKAAAC